MKMHPMRALDATFLTLTLIAAAIHFLDNAFHLDRYPGPPWLTRNEVLAAWLVLFVLACLAYWRGTRTALILYALLGFAGLAHYLAPHSHPMPVRSTLTIFLESFTSALLIAYALKGYVLGPKGPTISGEGAVTTSLDERSGTEARGSVPTFLDDGQWR